MTIDDKIKYIDDYKKAKNAATGSKYDANSNVTEKNLATLQCELGKKDLIDVNRRITCDYLTKLYGKETADAYLDDLKNHIIYRHDETALFPYCVSISLYPFLLHGLTNLGGSSLPPKHADSFMGGVINLIYLVAAQFAGAVSTPELLTYLDHFLRIDYGNDYMGHLDDNLEAFGNRRKTLRTKIEDMFQQFVYSVNQPAGARNYQSPFTNIAYFDRYYFENIFKDFVFPDGDQPCWESTSRLQKMFMEWFCEERTHALLTFPVETANILVKSTDHIDGDFPETLDRDINWDATQPKRDVNDYIMRHMVRKADGRYYYYADADMADFICHMDAKGHCPFVYQSDSVDALASCCFSGDTMTLTKSSDGVNFMSFKDLYNSKHTETERNFTVFHNGSWESGKTIKLSTRQMYAIMTSNNKKIVVSDNHLNVTLNGDKKTSDLTTNDYLMFNTRALDSYPEKDEHLSYAEGFSVGAFLGDGSFGSDVETKTEGTHIYDVNYSESIDKYEECMKMADEANRELGGSSSSVLGKLNNNLYPVRISSRPLVEFISKWTNWYRGTYSYNKELNMNCLLQSKEFRRGILDGWYHTDGGNSNRCYTVSKKLADCMEALLTSLGMSSIINLDNRTDEKMVVRGEEYNKNFPVYCVRWYDMKNRRSMKNVYKVINNSVFFKIKSIEKVDNFKDDIYCFEMKNTDEPYFTLPNGIITHNCRLRNEIKSNVFSTSLGAGGISTGSKCVITANLNRIVQDWSREGRKESLADYVTPIIKRIHKYLNAWNQYLHDDYDAGLLPVYKAGYISLDKQYLTVGVNGFVEAAEFLGYKISSHDENYKKLAEDVLSTIKRLNQEDRTKTTMFNTEFVPAENLGGRNRHWDEKDGYAVPDRPCYNSYFYKVEDSSCDVLEKFYLQGSDFCGCLDGGSAYHCNLEEALSQTQYRHLMDVAVAAGCSYFTYNVIGYECSDCGYISKSYGTVCSKCGSKNIDYITRVIGYLKRVSNFPEVRQLEFKRRYNANKQVRREK